MDYSNIPTGLKITSQIPLNVKEFCKDEDTLAYLGVDNNLAFTYHDQLEVLCLAEKSIYIWREVQPGEENTGLVPLDFTYPLLLPSTYNINYSGKTYNFFLKEYVTTDNIQDLIQIENIGTGAEIYKDSTVVGDNTQFNLKSLKLSQLGGGAEVIRELQDLSDEILFINRTLVSDSNSIDITVTDNTISLDINNAWLISFLQSNSNTLCEIFSNCTVDPIIEQGEFGYSLKSEATACLNSCNSTDLVQVYRDNVFGRFEQATMLSTDLAMTIPAPAGYYAEFSTEFGDSVARFWDGSNLGVPYLCGCL